MPHQIQDTYLEIFGKRLRSIKIFVTLILVSVGFFIVWSKESITTPIPETLQETMDINQFNDVVINANKTNHTKKLKYILLWTDREVAPFTWLRSGQSFFVNNNCKVTNCYITANKTYFGIDNYTLFDVIAFNGRSMKVNDLPSKRSPQQKYIYFNMDSAENWPVCDTKYDRFFNLTATYKLDSDILMSYIQIKDINDTIVGPKHNMQWIRNMEASNTSWARNKTKAVAWFVSHCPTISRREDFVKTLQESLSKYSYNVDIYGKCGTLKCSKKKNQQCRSMLRRDYYFYLSFENSFSEDYVTEKVLTALNHDVIPIVLGGADYSRFLPPGSYLNAREHTSRSLAATIDRLIRSKEEYNRYFRWKAYYTYHYAIDYNLCNICKVLNDKKIMKRNKVTEQVYNFRSWWNPLYKRCVSRNISNSLLVL